MFALRQRAVRALSTSSTPLPTVDIGGLMAGASAWRRSDAEHSLRRALLDEDSPGFFYAKNVPKDLDAKYLRETYNFVKRAHALPLEVKRRFADPDKGSGELGVAYNGPDAGNLEPSYDAVSTSVACAWDYTRRGAERQSAGWDAALPARFVETLDELYRRQNAVGESVLAALARILALPEGTFADSFSRGDLGTIRLIYYPGTSDDAHAFTAANSNSGDHAWTYTDEPEPDEEASDEVVASDVGIAPHTDFEAFTLMHQDAPGLQLLRKGERKDSQWLDAPVSDDFVVIIGDILERYTNGVLQATPHRVVRRAQPRRSIIRFNAVAPDTLVQPLPNFCRHEPPKYTPVTMQRHMDTTLGNLRRGVPCWDAKSNTSNSATYRY